MGFEQDDRIFGGGCGPSLLQTRFHNRRQVWNHSQSKVAFARYQNRQEQVMSQPRP